ncbi:hypothetical protein [Streptomyces sp. NPDC056600]|uniref:hypothetical protein n=1 Tax=Streptomyces sp. NPDC056600 TaxID=3345874 RepID=UPI0036889593
MGQDDVVYDASHIQVVEPLQAIRRRPGMYVLSTGPQGLHHQLFELSDWAVNEVLAGHGERVDVTLRSDGWVRVAVDGWGVPVAADGDTGSPTLQDLLSVATRRPADRQGVCCAAVALGPVVTNALSSRLVAEVRRQGVLWTQHYERGVATNPPTPTGRVTAGDATVITFQPDAGIFGTAEHSFGLLAETFSAPASLRPGLDLTLTDERPGKDPRSERYRFPGGATAQRRRSESGGC